MNKKILAAAALAIVSGSAMADGAQLYGILDLSIQNTSNQSSTQQTMSGMFDGLWLPSVWGIKGSEEMGDGMTAHYNLESNLTANTGAAASPLFLRASNVGIKGDFGDITAGGRLDPIWIQSVAEQAMGVRHVGSAGIATGVFTGANWQNPYRSIAGTGTTPGTTSFNNPNTTYAVFGSNWLYYNAPKFVDNLDINVGYQLGNVAGSQASGSGSYLGATYSKNGLTVNLGNEQQNDSTNTVRITRNLLGAMYKFGDFTVEAQEMRITSSGAAQGALAGTGGTNAAAVTTTAVTATGYVDAQVGQAGIAYQLNPKVNVGIQYVFVNDNYTGGRPTLTTLGATYSLSKRTSLYAVVQNSSSSTTNSNQGTVKCQAMTTGYNGGSTGGAVCSNASLTAIGMFHTF